jgi:hypothetical protein
MKFIAQVGLGLAQIRLAIRLQPQSKDYRSALEEFLQTCKESDYCNERP